MTMSDGAGALLSSGGGDGGAPLVGGDGGGAPAAAPAAAAAAPEPVVLQDWHKQFSPDPLDRDGPSAQEWVARKGFKDITEVAKAAREAEKALSTRVALPTDPADSDGWGKVWSKLGRPESPEGYEIKAPEGYEANAEFTKGFAKAMWESGANPRQVGAAVDFYNQTVLEGMAADAAAQKALVAQQQANLRSTWGSDYGKNIELARRGQTVLGMDAADVDAMGRAMGLDKALIKLAGLGMKTSEDFFRSGDSGGGQLTTMDPAEAQQQLDAWQHDPENRKLLLAGDANAKAKHARLVDQLATARDAKNKR